MPSPIRREMLLVRPPAELGRLRPFTHEAVHRPGVDELVEFLRVLAHLGIALGDVDDLDAQRLRELRPLLAAGGNLGFEAHVLGDIEERLFDQMGYQAGIRPMSEHGRGIVRAAARVLRSASAWSRMV